MEPFSMKTEIYNLFLLGYMQFQQAYNFKRRRQNKKAVKQQKNNTLSPYYYLHKKYFKVLLEEEKQKVTVISMKNSASQYLPVPNNN